MTVSSSDNKTKAVLHRLRDLVGSLDMGSRIPSERDLAAEWGIARMTARKAIETLTVEGWLDRRRGSGTYVSQMPYAKTLGLSSFTVDMERRGLVPTSRVLEFSHVLADAATAARLQVSEGAELKRFTRLRLADAEPIAVETTWMPAHLVPGLTEEDLAGSLFETLAHKFGIIPGQASSTIDPALPDQASAIDLDIDAHQPCLRIQMDYLDHRRRPIMAATCLYRGDRYQLHVVLTPAAFTAEPPPARSS
ncbi:MAG: GntR family transcriptional regulator [Acidimicrobiia bacterium]